MDGVSTILGAVLPVFLVIVTGLVLRRVNWLTAEADASLLRLTINLMVPCLAFDSILGNPAVAEPRNLLLAPLIGFGTVVLGMAVAAGVARWVPAETGATRRTFTFAVAVYNYGYVPVPLAMSLFDRDTVAVLFVHNVGVELALWSAGLLLLAGADPRREWRRLVSPPIVAILAAVVANVLFDATQVPSALRGVAHLLGQCAVPLGMLLIGATVADHLRPFAQARGGRAMALACGVRLGVLPLLFLGLAAVVPVSTALQRVMVLQAAMPAAVFPIVMARHYGGDVTTALRVVITTTVVSLFTMPLWIGAGLRWLRL